MFSACKTNKLNIFANVNFVPFNALKSSQWVCFGNRSRMTHIYLLGSLLELRQQSNSIWSTLGCPSMVYILRTLLHSAIYIYSLVPLLEDNTLLLHPCIIIMKPEKSKPIFKKVFSSSDPKSKSTFVPMAALRVLFSNLTGPKYCTKFYPK